MVIVKSMLKVAVTKLLEKSVWCKPSAAFISRLQLLLKGAYVTILPQ